MASDLYFSLNGSPQQTVHNHELYIKLSQRMTIKLDNYTENIVEINCGRKHVSIAVETQDIPSAIYFLKDNKYLFGPDRPYTQKDALYI